jgi:hypothetical protein
VNNYILTIPPREQKQNIKSHVGTTRYMENKEKSMLSFSAIPKQKK